MATITVLIVVCLVGSLVYGSTVLYKSVSGKFSAKKTKIQISVATEIASQDTVSNGHSKSTPLDLKTGMDFHQQVYLLPLKDDGSPDVSGGYVYLPPPTSPRYRLRFVIEGSSSICNKGMLWVNVPEDGTSFESSAFRGFEYVFLLLGCVETRTGFVLTH